MGWAWEYHSGNAIIVPSEDVADSCPKQENFPRDILNLLAESDKRALQMVAAARQMLNKQALAVISVKDSSLYQKVDYTDAGLGLWKYFLHRCELIPFAEKQKYTGTLKSLIQVYNQIYNGLKGPHYIVIDVDLDGNVAWVKGSGTHFDSSVSKIRSTLGFHSEHRCVLKKWRGYLFE